MDSITALNVVRDTLREKLQDPYVQAGGNYRGGDMWIFGDEPLVGAKFPQIQIYKFDNPSEPISIGSNYYEFEQLLFRVWFLSKNGFKVTVGGTTYTNAQLVEYELGQIKQTLKAQFNNMFNNNVKNYRHLNTSSIIYDKDTQLYKGYVIGKVVYFNR